MMPTPNAPIQDERRLARQFRALGNWLRLAIIRVLLRRSPHRATVEQLMEDLAVPRSTLSTQLGKLRHEGIVEKSPGRAGAYSLDSQKIKAIRHNMANYTESQEEAS